MIYKIDCDLGSFLYLGIAESLGLPLTFIEVPKHNFIRWNFNDKTHINWDVNSADFFSDDDFREGLSPTVNTAFNTGKETAYRYLENMDTSGFIGSYSWVIGRNLKKEKKYSEARKYYELAIEKWSYHPTPKLSLAYLITFYGVFNTREDHLIANKLAKEAVEIYSKENEYLETLACTYALLGNYDMAIKTILKTTPVNSQLKNAFENKKTGLDVYKPID
jgi:tetratricopeptide (TPR) repeat protein